MQLIGETTTKSLEYLLEDITQFYSSTAGDRYKVEDPQVGQVSARIKNRLDKFRQVGLPKLCTVVSSSFME